MISIITRGKGSDAEKLSPIAATTLLESHGHSAEPEHIQLYIREKYDPSILRKELDDPGNIYSIQFYNGRMVGFSRILLDTPYENSSLENVTKLDRIYVLKEFYGIGLGQELLDYNIRIAREQQQKEIWLHTWVENKRAIRFYEKNGFNIAGRHDFRVSPTHSNPNHLMVLRLID